MFLPSLSFTAMTSNAHAIPFFNIRSSLGPAVQDLGIEGVEPGFHGHAHNWLCQVQHHSKFMLGAGKDDFETCKRTFSESNALAPEIQNSTEFHRHQALDKHF